MKQTVTVKEGISLSLVHIVRNVGLWCAPLRVLDLSGMCVAFSIAAMTAIVIVQDLCYQSLQVHSSLSVTRSQHWICCRELAHLDMLPSTPGTLLCGSFNKLLLQNY